MSQIAIWCFLCLMTIGGFGENKVTFEASIDVFGQTPFKYHSSHGVIYQSLGWSHEERIRIIPSILPLGAEMAIAGRFKTIPREWEAYNDSFQVVPSDATLWTPWLAWAQAKARLGFEVQSQSYSAHQVPARIYFFEAEIGR